MIENLNEKSKIRVRLTAMQQLALGFLLVILVGAVLLWLPISNVEGHIPFIDALFSSTSAVCVTGLMTIVPATQFTIFGKVVLLCLIQIGGLGVIACTMGFFVMIGKKITVKERVVIQQSYNLDTLSGLVNLILKIIKMTLAVELIGAILFAIQFVPEYGAIGLWYAIFHSISAFCNAGIDLLGADSFMAYANNPLINFTTMMLIVVGGLGFTVWLDILGKTKLIAKGKVSFMKAVHKLQLHSKIVILMTFILIVSGTVLVALLEWNNPETLGNLNTPNKMMASLFQSVTTRTAGFATVNQAGLKEETAFISIILMFIGGSPAGTAGGVKTTTIFMIIITCVAIINGRRDTECFGRKIPETNIRTGMSIIIVSFAFLLLGNVLMNITEDASFIDVAYEIGSALGTVGLTRGLTPELSTWGKLIDIVFMYIGRTGPITIALAFGYRRQSQTVQRELPTKRIIVG